MRYIIPALTSLLLGTALATVQLWAADPPKPLPLYSQDAILAVIAEDLETLDPVDAGYTRYLSLGGMETQKELEEWSKLGTAQLHDLSRERGIFPLLDIGNPRLRTNPRATVLVRNILLRFDTRYFGKVFQEQWERLGAIDPYWHGDDIVLTNGYKDVEYGYWRMPDGSRYMNRGGGGSRMHPDEVWVVSRVEKEPTDQIAVTKHGFFVRTEEGKAAFKKIQTLMKDPRTDSYGTDTPVVDVAWFLGQTMAGINRDPGYHQFLGFSNLAEWERLVGLVRDPKAIDSVYLEELREAVAHSTVTTEEVLRRIIHFDKPGGDAWFTKDSDQRAAKFADEADPTETLGDKYRFDAIESLAHLPNGFVAKGLFNNKGVRQDIAPPNIASDSTAPYSDRQVHEGLCMRCHITGFQPINGWVRNVFNSQPNFLATKDPKERIQIQKQYVDTRLEPYLEGSRKRYAESMFQATGWKPEEYSAALKIGWKKYVEGPVDVGMAARKIGVTKLQFEDALTAAPLVKKMKAEGKTDLQIAEAVAVATTKMKGTLSVFRPGPNQSTRPAVLFQRDYQRAVDVTYGVVRPYAVSDKAPVKTPKAP